MARERKRVMGQLAAFEISMIASMFGGEQIDPDTINPYGVRPRMSKANRELMERDKKEQFRASQRREQAHGKARTNVKHFPIMVK